MNGGSRFQNGGSLWKSSWRRQTPFDQTCCFEGFSTGLGGVFYQEPGGALDLVPAGWFVAALVGLEAPPSPSPGTIARNGNVVDEGWILDVIDAGAGDVQFRFTVFGGAGPVAQVVQADTFALLNVGDSSGFIEKVFFPVMAGFLSAAAAPPDGAIFLVTPNQAGGNFFGTVSPAVALSAPYVNSDPLLTVGVGLAGQDLRAPSCIQGITGGQATWPAAFSGIARDIYQAWHPLVDEANQIVEVPDATPSIGLINDAGWRADPLSDGQAPAPNPLAPFVQVAAPNLVYGGAGAPFVLGQDCVNPMRLFPANLRFPFTSVA